ncbi:Uncharacterised protein [Mycobacteroides abscessus]|uniref:hypothetical protein n=1 Tax=Mycobacteroides abscessus TaxID=36809 RepID=UPI0005DCAA3E|nr:hypothetical protein [Mycobacteroides abscessus]CPU00360.1 Uncharacterised protein [Mycobacteroides abscessus]CPX01118.1 Uncharacterised protein [Mycobacteroides abscessus]CQA10600.1 Uncharacterised protein [Mycobacteroides abscessus]
MSLVFTTKTLITAAEKAIKNHNTALARWEQDRDDYLRAHQQAWIKTSLPRVRELRTTLTEMLKPGKAITLKQIRDAANAGNDIEGLFYNPPSEARIKGEIGSKPSLNIDHYRGLIDLLKAHTGQTISASQLKMVGYDSLTELFRDALGTEGAC